MKICNEAYIVFVALVVCSAVVFGPIILSWVGLVDWPWYGVYGPLMTSVGFNLSFGAIYEWKRKR